MKDVVDTVIAGLNRRALPDLPTPSAAEFELSTRLSADICRQIADAGGAIDFASFMELALYAPGLGYYSAGKFKFGAAGDFVTAPELSPLFAQILAVQCAPVLRVMQGDILEVGAGSGVLAVDLLRTLAAVDALPQHYYIVELSADLRARQAAAIERQLPMLFKRVCWLDTLPKPGFRGVVVANELLDAMPVQRFIVGAHGAHILDIVRVDSQFQWRLGALSPDISARIAALNLPEGYLSEINTRAEAWIRSIADVLIEGLVLLIDYGFPRNEFYHPQRSEGTLMCHYRHRAHDNPLVLAGLQDITAHIDFTAIAEAAHGAGLDVLGYTSQAAFLLALGLLETAASGGSTAAREHLAHTQQVKKLTLPSEMGELFKVIAFGRGIDMPLNGFKLQDRRGRL